MRGAEQTRGGRAATSRRAVETAQARAERRATELRLSLAVFVAIMLACFGLHLLLDGAAWWLELAFVSAFVLGAAALTRAQIRPQTRASTRWRRVLPSLVAVLVLMAFVVVRFAADTAILAVLPSGGTIERVVGLAGEASASIHNQAVPATVDTGILLFLVSGVGAIAIVMDLLAIGFGAPALAGIPLLLLFVVPAMTDLDLSDGFAFALAAAGYLWLLLAGRRHRRIRLSVVAGSLAIVAALVVPLALPPVQAEGGGGSGLVTTGINPTINLGKDLTSKVTTTALIYTMDSGDSQYLRMVTLDRFSGSDWAPDDPKQRRSNGVDSFAAPAGLSSKVARTKETTKISIGNLRSPWLPLPYPTSSVAGLWGDWFWESGSLAVSSPNVGIANQNYVATSLAIHPTPAQLSAAGSVVPAGFEKYLALPAKLPAIISDTAKQVAGGEQGSYAKAVALQQYFRSDVFSYSVEAPVDEGYDGTGMAVVAKFLEVKTGYCVHFASAMAVMARSLGIPARIAVGFQPGSSTDTDGRGRNVYKVTSHDLHAWPELYFDQIGWVAFEPTPGRGEVPSYADLSVPGVPTPISPAQQVAESTATPTPAAGQDGRPDQRGDVGSVGSAASQTLIVWAWVAAGLVLLLILLLLPAVLRSLSRARRLRAATAGNAWREVMTTAEDVGLRLPTTMTPREAALALAPAAGGEQLDRLRVAVERESYASGAPPRVDVTDVRGVTARMLAGAAPRQRLLARFAPPSSWRRVLRVFARSSL